VTLQIVRDWVMKFNALGPDGLIDRRAPGQPSGLNDAHRAALAAMIERGPTPAIHGVVRWRIVDLCQWLYEEFDATIWRVLRIDLNVCDHYTRTSSGCAPKSPLPIWRCNPCGDGLALPGVNGVANPRTLSGKTGVSQKSGFVRQQKAASK